eukprot:4850056-Prymnesium_polylepis.2
MLLSVLLAAAAAAPSGSDVRYRPPLKRVWRCDDGSTATHEACGPAVPNRTVWNVDWCRLQQNVVSRQTSLAGALQGKTIDV